MGRQNGIWKACVCSWQVADAFIDVLLIDWPEIWWTRAEEATTRHPTRKTNSKSPSAAQLRRKVAPLNRIGGRGCHCPLVRVLSSTPLVKKKNKSSRSPSVFPIEGCRTISMGRRPHSDFFSCRPKGRDRWEIHFPKQKPHPRSSLQIWLTMQLFFLFNLKNR